MILHKKLAFISVALLAIFSSLTQAKHYGTEEQKEVFNSETGIIAIQKLKSIPLHNRTSLWEKDVINLHAGKKFGIDFTRKAKNEELAMMATTLMEVGQKEKTLPELWNRWFSPLTDPQHYAQSSTNRAAFQNHLVAGFVLSTLGLETKEEQSNYQQLSSEKLKKHCNMLTTFMQQKFSSPRYSLSKELPQNLENFFQQVFLALTHQRREELKEQQEQALEGIFERWKKEKKEKEAEEEEDADLNLSNNFTQFTLKLQETLLGEPTGRPTPKVPEKEKYSFETFLKEFKDALKNKDSLKDALFSKSDFDFIIEVKHENRTYLIVNQEEKQREISRRKEEAKRGRVQQLANDQEDKLINKIYSLSSEIVETLPARDDFRAALRKKIEDKSAVDSEPYRSIVTFFGLSEHDTLVIKKSHQWLYEKWIKETEKKIKEKKEALRRLEEKQERERQRQIEEEFVQLTKVEKEIVENISNGILGSIGLFSDVEKRTSTRREEEGDKKITLEFLIVSATDTQITMVKKKLSKPIPPGRSSYIVTLNPSAVNNERLPPCDNYYVEIKQGGSNSCYYFTKNPIKGYVLLGATLHRNANNLPTVEQIKKYLEFMYY